MKTLVCTYCEGNDYKIAVIAKDKSGLKVLKAFDMDIEGQRISGQDNETSKLKLDEGLGDISLTESAPVISEGGGYSSEALVSSALTNIDLNSALFIPTVTEPALHYHIIEGGRAVSSVKEIQSVIDEIHKTKNIDVTKDNIAITELAGNASLAVIAEGEFACVGRIAALAKYNGRRYYKIPTVKSAELSLSNYVAGKKNFFPEDNSLIVYIGKEYSKLIFLQGKKLKHLGATLDIGTQSLSSYDVYFSKILLEMENGSIHKLDNIILCGDDDSESLQLSFSGTFPESDVSKLVFDEFDVTALDELTKERLSAFTVPFAAGVEYFEELAGEFKGINLLPRYIKDEQKILQFGWHSYLLMPLIFIATLFFTQTILKNSREIKHLNEEVLELQILQRDNQKILDQIKYYEKKINTFSSTQALLDTASKGTGAWGNMTNDMSAFIGGHKNMWISSFQREAKGKLDIEGYAVTRSVLTAFANNYNSSLLKNITYEPLRKKTCYKFALNFSM